MPQALSIGIVGGTGALGGAIGRALLKGGVKPERLWLSNRTGSAAGFEDWPGVRIVTRNQVLVGACEILLLSVPPALAPDIDVSAPDKLVVSVMAGVTRARLTELTGASCVVRAMSSPAAEHGLAYSPWIAAESVSEDDKAQVKRLFEACGLTDEVHDEDQIDRFTALTGPVPGFVAYFADCMTQYAMKHGVEPRVAERAMRQLFRASGVMLAEGAASPAGHVRAMIEYAGTTAAGLEAMQDSPLADAIAQGLDAAYEKAKTIG